MRNVYVKDEEGFVIKKPADQVKKNEIVITAAEYHELSGDNYYKEHFGHGGKREGAGRKTVYSSSLNYQMRVSASEKKFIVYAREHSIDCEKLIGTL